MLRCDARRYECDHVVGDPLTGETGHGKIELRGQGANEMPLLDHAHLDECHAETTPPASLLSECRRELHLVDHARLDEDLTDSGCFAHKPSWAYTSSQVRMNLRLVCPPPPVSRPICGFFPSFFPSNPRQ